MSAAAGRSCLSAVLVSWGGELCLPPIPANAVKSEHSSRVSKPLLQQKKGSSEAE